LDLELVLELDLRWVQRLALVWEYVTEYQVRRSGLVFALALVLELELR